jgi:hypothetical protein
VSEDLFKKPEPQAVEAVQVERALELTPVGQGAMADLMRAAVEKGGVDALERLVALQDRMVQQSAAREFAAAMAAFQRACPPIRKTSSANVTTKSGSSYSYDYAELDEIATTVGPHLHVNGLSYWWDSVVSDDGKRLTTDCTVAHANGHSRKSSFTSPVEAATSAMSKQQEMAAALTVGRRQSLISALGLTTCDPDRDGVRAPEPKVTPDQVTILMDLIDKRPAGSYDGLLRWIGEQWGARSLDEIPASKFDWLKADLEKKLRSQK